MIPTLNLSGFPCKDCGCDAAVSSKGFLFPVGVNGCTPKSFGSGVVDAMMAAGVVLHYCLIALVAGSRNISQVFNAVVGSVPVYMVDLINWVCAVVHLPNEAVGRKLYIIKANTDISIFLYSARQFPREASIPKLAFPSGALSRVFKHVRRSLAPKQFTRRGIVTQNLVQVLMGRYGFLGHFGSSFSGLIERAGAGTPARNYPSNKGAISQHG